MVGRTGKGSCYITNRRIVKQEIAHEQTTFHFMKLVGNGVNVVNGCSFEDVTAVLLLQH